MVRLREVWGASQNKICTDPWAYCATAQVVVSSQRIQRMPRQYYHELMTLLVAPEDHPVHKDYMYLHNPSSDLFKEREKGNNNDGLFGHVLERGWALLWDCHNAALQQECDCSTGGPDSEKCNKCRCIDTSVAAQDSHAKARAHANQD